MANLLNNPGFETPSGTGPSEHTGPGPGSSAADKWTTFNNTNGTTTTDLVPSLAPSGNRNMLHVCTTGDRNGIVQLFGVVGKGPAGVQSSVWVFVLRGQVGMGTGNGGSTNDTDKVNTKVRQWEQLSAPNGRSPANEFIVYAVSQGKACFYVDNASVTA